MSRSQGYAWHRAPRRCTEDPPIRVAAMIANFLECRGTPPDGRYLPLHVRWSRRFRIFTEATFDEGPIAQTDGDEDVEPCTAIDQQSHTARVADEVRAGRRLVIDVACIDLCAVIEQYSAISTVRAQCSAVLPSPPRANTSVDRFRSAREAIELPEVCCGEDVHDRAARNQLGLLWCDVPLQQAEGPCPPIALQVQIRAVLIRTSSSAVLPRGHRRPSAEQSSRSIHGGTHFGVSLSSARTCSLSPARPADELLQRRLRERINLRRIAAQLSNPAASHDELGVRERERVAGGWPGVEGANAPQRIRVTRRSGAQQVFRPFRCIPDWAVRGVLRRSWTDRVRTP